MTELDRQKVFAGRLAVDAYREAHRLLHQKPYYRGIHDDHTPLLNSMKAALVEHGFDTIQEFFDASEEFEIAEGIEEGERWR